MNTTLNNTIIINSGNKSENEAFFNNANLSALKEYVIGINLEKYCRAFGKVSIGKNTPPKKLNPVEMNHLIGSLFLKIKTKEAEIIPKLLHAIMLGINMGRVAGRFSQFILRLKNTLPKNKYSATMKEL